MGRARHERGAALTNPEHIPASDVPDELRELADQLGFDPTEKLLPVLELCLVDTDYGRALKHPLLFDVPYFEQMAGFANERYRQKKQAVEEAYAEGRYSTYVFLHERPHRLDAFMEVESVLNDREYWETLADIWTDTENSYQQYTDWRTLLDSERAGREHMMDDDERAALAALPDEFDIYRGFNGEHEDKQLLGFSWTLDRDRAQWFAERFSAHRGDARLAHARIRCDDVIARFDGRGEDEIVALPESLIAPRVER